jgi:hypothetical protein
MKQTKRLLQQAPLMRAVNFCDNDHTLVMLKFFHWCKVLVICTSPHRLVMQKRVAVFWKGVRGGPETGCVFRIANRGCRIEDILMRPLFSTKIEKSQQNSCHRHQYLEGEHCMAMSHPQTAA